LGIMDWEFPDRLFDCPIVIIWRQGAFQFWGKDVRK